MDASLLQSLRKSTRLEQQNSLYAQFCRLEAIPGLTGLCSVDRCASDFVTAGGTAGGWSLCSEHYLAACRSTRRRHIRALFWQALIQKCFSDEAVFDRIYARGRYLKLCAMAEAAARLVDESWRTVADEASMATKKCRTRRSAYH